MKSLKILFVLSLILGCQKPNRENLINGTWNKCNKDGSYWEYKITDQYFIMFSTKFDLIGIYAIKNINNGIVLSDSPLSEIQLMINEDTLKIISETKKQVVLKSTYTSNKFELNKAEFDIEQIDSIDLESWKNKNLTDFKKRADIKNCKDLRTENERVIDSLKFDSELEEEILIEIIEK